MISMTKKHGQVNPNNQPKNNQLEEALVDNHDDCVADVLT
jgi:hypothetical protein